MKFTERIVQSYGYPPSQNDLWLDLSDNTLKFYDGGEWKPVNGGGLVSQFQSLSEGDLHAVKVALGLEEEDDGGGDDEGDEEPNYFTFEAKKDGAKIYFIKSEEWWDEREGAEPDPARPEGMPSSPSVQISGDGINWTTKESSEEGTLLATLALGEKLYLKGNNPEYVSYVNDDLGWELVSYFGATDEVYIYGNMMTLIDGEDAFEKGYNPSAINWALPRFYVDSFTAPDNLDIDSSNIYSHPEKDILLPATSLSDRCYSLLFNSTSISRAPELPATVMKKDCYSYMFGFCQNLTIAPALPATTLDEQCYASMFVCCENLVSVPESLPATTLAYSCYNGMFSGCTSLVSAPLLPATELTTWCYARMFNGCTSLNYIKALFTEWPDDINATNSWAVDVPATGTFVKSNDAEWQTEYGVHNVPTGWTVISESEEAAS